MTKPQWQNRIVGHENVAPQSIMAHPLNFRTHPAYQQKALTAVLDRVGYVQDVIVNRRTGHLIDGHLRVELAVARAEPTIPVVFVDLDDDEERLMLATLDPLAGMAVNDQEMLTKLTAGLAFEDETLRRLLADVDGSSKKPKEGLTDPDELPEKVAPRAKRGDLWLLGEHRLLCGDSTLPDDVRRLMGDERADCMWTDPPYGVKYVGKTKDALTIQNDGAEGLPAFLKDAFAAAMFALVPGAPFYIARPAGAQGLVFGDVIRALGWSLHEELQWVKDTMVLGHSDYHLQHETIMYGWLPGEGRSGRGRHEGTRWYGPNNAVSIFEVPRPKRSPDHPTGKPVALVEAHLANSTPPDGLVFEPFSGSGTTLMAAHRLGRRCFAIEIEPAYADVAIARWESHTGRKAEVCQNPEAPA